MRQYWDFLPVLLLVLGRKSKVIPLFCCLELLPLVKTTIQLIDTSFLVLFWKEILSNL